MSKTQAGERTRTVTVVVGPNTVKVMEDVNRHVADMTGQQLQTLTDLAGACLNRALTLWRRELLNEGLKVAVSHWD
jgi:hypothetical protein